MYEHSLITFPILLALVIYMISIKKGKQVCDNYVLVSYLYALFYLSLMSYIIAIIIVNFEDKLMAMPMMYILVIALIDLILTISIYTIPVKYIVLKHVISLIYVLVSSVVIAFIFLLYAPEAIALAFGATSILFALITLFAWKFQNMISTKIPLILIIAFFVLIIAEFVISIIYPNSLLEKAVVLLVLLAVCYLLLVKTKRIIENDKNCPKTEGPDYVKEGIGLLLSFQNLIIRILQLFGKRKR
jgi:FtsH-binding integral membrane protein